MFIQPMISLGCVPYINALPFTDGLDPKAFEVISRPPAELLGLLRAGKVDAALLPIVDYFENPDLYLMPDMAIATRGAVMSVRLFVKRDLEIGQLQFIYLDPESKTSQLLLKILLQNRYGVSLSNITFLSDPNDPRIQASLLIGDKALIVRNSSLFTLHSSQEYSSYDLGELWTTWTDKPFVFAAWMTTNKNLSSLAHTLQESRNRGLKNISSISKSLPQYPEALLKEYFTTAVHYYMGPQELAGIETFYQFLKPLQGYSHELNFKFVSKD